VSEISFPGPGPDGEQPPPVGPARDEAAGAAASAEPDRPGAREETAGLPPGVPAGVPADDWDGDAEMAAYIADLDAGRARIPEEWETSDAV
jgi:hypothetical protein